MLEPLTTCPKFHSLKQPSTNNNEKQQMIQMLGFGDDEWMGWHNDLRGGQGVGQEGARKFDSSAMRKMQIGWDENSARRNYTKSGVFAQ